MEKVSKRVSKRHIASIITVLAIGCIIGSTFNKKVEEVENKTFVVYNPLMENALQDMKKEAEKPKAIEESSVVEEKVVEDIESDWESYRLTHYVSNCKGCSGTTKAEINVENITEYHGYKILSVDTRKIPLGSIVEIKDGDEIYKAIAIDTGGAIKGNKLDLLVGSVKEAKNLGVKKIMLRVVRVGWQDEKKKL